MTLDEDIAAALRLHREGRAEEALTCCLPLLAHDLADFRIHFLLGMLYRQLDNIPAAVTHFNRASELQPDLASAHYNLGVLYYSAGNLDQAEAAYRRAAELAPEDPDIFFNLALTCKNLGRYDEAERCYQQVLALNPDDSDTHYNLGVLLRETDQPDAAIAAFTRTVTLAPGYLAAYKHLGALHHLLGNTKKALVCYRTILQLDPGNESARHMIAALSGETPTASPLTYVQELFDRFAAAYETTMTDKLASTVEIQLRELLDQHVAGLLFARGLDMGCGTGLSGLAFRDRVKHLSGFDISAGMLDKAREKGIYDELYLADISTFLGKTTERFDLFLAADVFVYLGDLAAIFTLVRDRARPGALFLFSAETGIDDFQLRSSGRFAHGTDYIDRLARQSGFTVACRQPAELRREKGEWITGHLFLLRLGKAAL
ncbi:MAG: tetratricopeptide repeat protein [Thermodesulfobacteriota bacterium]